MDTSTEPKSGAADPGGVCATESDSDASWCREIAERIGAGDASAESLLIERIRPGIRMVIRSRGVDLELAADLCQDTLIIVLNRLRSRSIDDPSRVAAFAAQTARQLAFDARRRFAIRKTVVDSDAVETAAGEAPVDESVEQSSLVTLVRQLLAELSHDRDREILRRFYLQEQDKAEICRHFGLAPGTFDQLVFRARARLRSLLQVRGLSSTDLLCAVCFWVPKSWMN